MSSSSLLYLVLGAGGVYAGKLWWDDLQAARAGRAAPRPLPGATPARPVAIVIAVAGALALLAAETAGENALGLTARQSSITWLFGLYSLTAAIIEEIIFRGFLVVENRGAAVKWAAIVAASALFALLHDFLWHWKPGGGIELTLDAKGAFSTAVVFATSLWLYAARFGPWNPSRSLLPCIAGHAAKNAGVIAIKFAQGFVTGLW